MSVLQDFFPIVECFLPLIAVCWIISVRLPDFSLKTVLTAVLAGLLALMPIIALQTVLPRSIPYLLRIFISNGLIEESLKMLMLFLLPYKKTKLKNFFILAVLSGLSLGTFETIIYVLNGQQNILLRLFTAVLLHGFCAGLSSFFVWNFRHGKKEFLPFICAVILHTLYNFFAGLTGIFWWFSLAAIGLAVSLCARFYEKYKDNPY